MATAIDRFNAVRAAACLAAVQLVVCVAIRTAVAVAGDAGEMYHRLMGLLALPSGWEDACRVPWTLLSYALLQYDLPHLLFNLFWLMCGAWLIDRANTVRGGYTILWLFADGALSGAIGYILAATVWGVAGQYLMGSSAAVLGVICGVCALTPRRRFKLIPGVQPLPVSIAAVMVLAVDVACLWGTAPGAHVAHLCGGLAGVAAALLQPKSPADVRRRPAAATLDKLRRSGYGSLTPAERAMLSSSSDHNKP